MNYNESAENYLETILMLSKALPVVRAVDIANELGFKKSSVSVEDGDKTAKVLDSAGLINWMTLNQQNSFYKNGERTVIVGTVKGLEGTFVEIEEYPSISGLKESEKFQKKSKKSHLFTQRGRQSIKNMVYSRGTSVIVPLFQLVRTDQPRHREEG